MQFILPICWLILIWGKLLGQEFKTLPDDLQMGKGKLDFGNILITTRGTALIAGSGGLTELDDFNLQIQFTSAGSVENSEGRQIYLGKNSGVFKDLYISFSGIRFLCEGPDKIIYLVTGNNNLGFIAYSLGTAISHPPFNFQISNNNRKKVHQIWIDAAGTLFIATDSDTLYSVENSTRIFPFNSSDRNFFFTPGLDKDSNYLVMQGARPIQFFTLPRGVIAHCFCQSPDDKDIVLIGTNNGLYGYHKRTGQSINYFKSLPVKPFTITHLEADSSGLSIWFSTLENGMARFNTVTKSIHFYPYPKTSNQDDQKYPINTFSRKSADEMFVAIADSLPAVFNLKTGNYTFISDTSFSRTPNWTTDIKVDGFGNLVITKGGGIYWSKTYLKKNAGLFAIDTSLLGPYIHDITINGSSYWNSNAYFGRMESLRKLEVDYTQHTIGLFFSCRGIPVDSLEFNWKLDNYSTDWASARYSAFGDEMNALFFDLKPGDYLFHLKARNKNGAWLAREVQLLIIVTPPFWQTGWFWGIIILTGTLLVFTLVKWRVANVRKQERLKSQFEKEALELEARALRAQMNPHFIFNCMNSIKSLIQQKDEDKAVTYLTTFSKLLRTILQNCDKREISLFEELQTCQLYTQLESMRFGNKIAYSFQIPDGLDLKSVMIPALIIQPFIENSIWHGIMPRKEGGSLLVSVEKQNGSIVCTVDDDGIGRELSRQNKFRGEGSAHESKGIHLTQARLNLDNLLYERDGSVRIFDKKDEAGKACGTTVILTFKEE